MRAGRPSVAIVGAGLMGRWHAQAAARSGAQVAAIVDPDPQRGASLARRFGAAALSDVAAVFDLQARPSVGHVCTPADTHLAIARRLIDGGLHVVCEKPLAAATQDVAQLYAWAGRAQRQVCPVHQFTAQRGFAEALSALPRIGELKRITFTFNTAGGARHPQVLHDALVTEILPHPLSVLGKLQPRHPLAEIAWQVHSPEAGELVAAGAHGRAIVSIAISLSARPTQASAILAGSAGTIAIDFFHGYATVNRGEASRVDKALRPFITSLGQLGAASRNALRRAVAWEPAYPGLRSLFAGFYASIDGSGRPAPFDAAEVIDVYRARDHIAAQIACKHPS